MVLVKDGYRIILTWTSLTEACLPYSRLPKMNIPLASGETIYMIFGHGPPLFVFISKTSQELRMQSRSVSDCKSLTLNVMIQVSTFVSNSHLCQYVTKSLNRSQSKSKSLSL